MNSAILLCVIIVCLLPVSVQADESATAADRGVPGIEVSLISTKGEYDAREPIDAVITVRNRSERAFHLLGRTRPLLPHIEFELMRKTTARKETADGIELTKVHDITLEPGQTLRVEACLSQLFDLRAADEYTVRAQLVGSWDELTPELTRRVRFPVYSNEIAVTRDRAAAISARMVEKEQ